MFTGLVQSLGRITAIADDGHGGRVLRIAEPTFAPNLVLGESIAVNGVCLTVVDIDDESFQFQAGPETLQKTNLGELIVDNRVNLERALRVGDSLGGHFVTGHVDAVGTIAERTQSGEWETASTSIPVASSFTAIIVSGDGFVFETPWV